MGEAMTEKNKIHSGTLTQNPSQREMIHSMFAREAAAQGIVLLKNEDILPLERSKAIALFGAGAGKTVKGGIGRRCQQPGNSFHIPGSCGRRCACYK